MADVFVVMGTTGDYSDRIEWSVAAYLDEAKAETHVQLAEVRARELSEWKCPTSGNRWRYADEATRPLNEHDLNMQMDQETSYFIYQCPLLDAVPGVVIEAAPIPEPIPSTAKPLWERLDEED